MNPGRGFSKRGVGCQFGPDVTERFLELNKLDYIIRSHEVKDNGYEIQVIFKMHKPKLYIQKHRFDFSIMENA